MSTKLFDPRDRKCKSPFGAVVPFAAVDFTFHPQGEAITGVTLLAYHEFSDRWTEVKLLPYEEGGVVTFSGTFFAPSEPELVWYHFRLDWADGGTSCYGQKGFESWDKVTPWQLTVYDDRAKTPDWFGRGVTYQIFPDRFFRAKKRDVSGLVGHRVLRENWDETPAHTPNAYGEHCWDFFGGDLMGIAQKLDHLASLGVTTLYLNPIFEASTNHRYDTADYENIDPLLGTIEDFRALCAEAKARGMRVMLDGVFNHTGAKSRYFNQDGFYPTLGAAQSPDSPYASWYNFHPFPDDFDAWWGIKDLPAVNEGEKSYVNFIAAGENSIIRRYLRLGADGWRLDVADELPDEFIVEIRKAMRDFPDSYLIGEVWEDASHKIAYSKRRRYLLGSELHGVMNYPFRTALLDYLRGGDAAQFREQMETLRENYPPAAFYGAMNFLSTHDTPRLLTLLGCKNAPADRAERGEYRLTPEEREHGTALLKLAALVMFAFPGSPTVYYGDEAGMEGFEDPFNRRTYPWGHEDEALLAHFRTLGTARRDCEALNAGDIEYLTADGAVLAFRRSTWYETAVAAVNAGETEQTITLPWDGEAVDVLTKRRFSAENGALTHTLPPCSGVLLLPFQE
ncbi:MAG: alpha-glucosidase C-terminal domain-containing protein [Oscillospiraceae bacterium]|nr:alpha-glucosidase C-terminal domain-containing protein [Oscillospiraceae bacterium]